MNQINFTFSDTIAGYVTKFDKQADTFGLRTTDGREYAVKFAPGTYAWIANNLEEPRQWVGGQMRDMLQEGRFLYVYGVYYPESGDNTFEAQFIIFVGKTADNWAFERQDWWMKQIVSLGDFYLKAQFGDCLLYTSPSPRD